MISIILFYLIGFFFWVVCFYILFRARDIAFYFLAAQFFIIGISLFTKGIILGNMISVWPHFYGILMPLQFLYGPLYYFFLMWVFKKRTQFYLKDSIHLIPFLFNLIDFIPFYVLPATDKIELYQSKGILSILGFTNELYSLLKLYTYCFYLLISGLFYFEYTYLNNIENKKKTRFIHLWLRVDFLLKCVAVVFTIFFAFFKNDDSFTMPYYIYCADALLNITILFKWPSLLRGIHFNYVGYQPTTIAISNFLKKNYIQYFVYKNKRISSFGINTQRIYALKANFKSRDFNPHKLSVLLQINERELEEFSRKEFGCKVASLISLIRLEILTDIMSKLDSDKLLLKKIVFEAGFDSLVQFENVLDICQDDLCKKCFSITTEDYYFISEMYRKQVNPAFI